VIHIKKLFRDKRDFPGGINQRAAFVFFREKLFICHDVLYLLVVHILGQVALEHEIFKGNILVVQGVEDRKRKSIQLALNGYMVIACLVYI
jgi:hypothetical protein